MGLTNQDNWNHIIGDLEGVFNEFFERGILNSSLVETLVCLIPRKGNANKIKEFRRISLFTSVYKIFAKVLVDRLRYAL